ncbi:uncharacterized protein LY89DRAFT_721365 [Mollisia scopiformis]|uniref:Uncharacterized protein n=1 Tax=Mollisia scopiformis TaxID=149040 RepID=A0A194WZF0_MOLSC|nr:uncharacterized protein LY89DRAFT_721365 [Mollisia scopiformis]KUJ13331.1 hypothetical protein LY89DRAFT_721365 [Mollisia scopiformis]
MSQHLGEPSLRHRSRQVDYASIYKTLTAHEVRERGEAKEEADLERDISLINSWIKLVDVEALEHNLKIACFNGEINSFFVEPLEILFRNVNRLIWQRRHTSEDVFTTENTDATYLPLLRWILLSHSNINVWNNFARQASKSLIKPTRILGESDSIKYPLDALEELHDALLYTLKILDENEDFEKQGGPWMTDLLHLPRPLRESELYSTFHTQNWHYMILSPARLRIQLVEAHDIIHILIDERDNEARESRTSREGIYQSLLGMENPGNMPSNNSARQNYRQAAARSPKSDVAANESNSSRAQSRELETSTSAPKASELNIDDKYAQLINAIDVATQKLHSLTAQLDSANHRGLDRGHLADSQAESYQVDPSSHHSTYSLHERPGEPRIEIPRASTETEIKNTSQETEKELRAQQESVGKMSATDNSPSRNEDINEGESPASKSAFTCRPTSLENDGESPGLGSTCTLTGTTPSGSSRDEEDECSSIIYNPQEECSDASSSVHSDAEDDGNERGRPTSPRSITHTEGSN